MFASNLRLGFTKEANEVGAENGFSPEPDFSINSARVRFLF